jgi:signal transduction histidine kinase
MRQRVSALRRRVGDSLMLRSPVNRAVAWSLAVLGPVIVALGLLPVRSSVGLAGFLAGAQLVVILVAVIGGIWPALLSAVVALLLGAFAYSPPFDSLSFDVQADFVAFLGFVIVAAVVGILIDQFARLAKEQAALRRVATLVARAATADELFAAVTEEVARQLPVDFARMGRYESDDSITFVAAWGSPADGFPAGSNLRLDGESVRGRVFRTGRPARIDNYDQISGPLGQTARELGMRSSVGVPIIVNDRMWGVMAVSSTTMPRYPADTEVRLAAFMELLSTAIANAESRAELAASRARVVAAADETRRRIERDLHDGTQQRLVSLAIELRAAEARMPAELVEHKATFSHAVNGLTQTLENLQEISRGIHPAILSKGGLGPAVKALARRSAAAVELDLRVDRRLPEQVEVAAYYVVSEALTNVDKYAQASLVHIDVHASGSAIELAIRDDGIGGADPNRGSGLVGLKDRVEALGGTITIAGRAGEGTSVVARIPIEGNSALAAERRDAITRPP